MVMKPVENSGLLIFVSFLFVCVFSFFFIVAVTVTAIKFLDLCRFHLFTSFAHPLYQNASRLDMEGCDTMRLLFKRIFSFGPSMGCLTISVRMYIYTFLSHSLSALNIICIHFDFIKNSILYPYISIIKHSACKSHSHRTLIKYISDDFLVHNPKKMNYHAFIHSLSSLTYIDLRIIWA